MTENQNKKDKNNNKTKRPWWKRVLRAFIKIFLVLFILIIALILFIRSPWGQDIIVNKVTSYISNETNTKVSIEKLFITFSGEIELLDLYLEDKQHDTLIYSKQLLVEIPIWPIIKGNPVSIDGLKWNGLRANINRKDSVNGFNYQFLIDAFATDSVTTEDKPTGSSKPLKIAVGSIDFIDFKINYHDDVAGTKTNIDLGNFHFEGKDFDLEKMKFEIAGISLKNTTLTYIQTKNIPLAETDSSKTTLPYLSLDNLKLDNVNVNYISKPDGINTQLNISDLVLQVPKADLSLQEIQINRFSLNNSNIKVKLSEQIEPETKPIENTRTSTPLFIWPNWNVQINTVALQNNYIDYQLSNDAVESKEFNSNHIVLNEFNFKANEIVLSKNESAKINLEEFSFQEQSGLNLKQLSFSAAIAPTLFSVDKLIVSTESSSVNTDLKINYSSLQQFINKPEESPISLDLFNFNINVNDVFKFQPELSKNEYLKKLTKHKLTGQIKASGKLSKMNLSTFLVNWGKSTKITSQGEFLNLLDADDLVADINNFTFNSTKVDLANFISEKDIGVSIPKTVSIQTQLQGKLANFNTKMQLTVPEGKIKIDGQFKQEANITFNTRVNIIELNLGNIFNNPKIGLVTGEIKASGKGKTISNLDAVLSSNFSKLELNNYDFSALKLNGKLNNGDGNITLLYKDENLDLGVDSKIKLDSVLPKITVVFNMEGADFYALGLSEKQLKAKLILNANFEGNANIFNFKTQIHEGVAIYDGNIHYLGAVNLVSSVTKDSIALKFNSNFLNGTLLANSGISGVIGAIQNHLESYFSDSTQYNTSSNPVKLEIDMKLSETELITDFLVPEIKAMDTIKLYVNFDQADSNFTANLSLPHINYADKIIDSLQFNISSTDKEAKFKLGFNRLEASPLLMSHTYFDGDFQNGLLNLHFHALEGEKELYSIKSEIYGKTSELNIHLNPDNLILYNKKWTISSDNKLVLKKDKVIAQNFVLSRNEQSVKLSNNLDKTNQDNFGVQFNNFKLANILALLNKDDLIVNGVLQGNIVSVNSAEGMGLKADFSINNLTALKTNLGNLTLNTSSQSIDIYNIDLDLKGDDIDVEINGDYSLQNLGSELDFKVNLNKIGVKTIASLSGESLEDASGNISGEFVLNGSPSNPDYKGYVQFNDANFKVNQLNSSFSLTNNRIGIDNSTITLTNFSIQDEKKNTFTLNGSVSTEKILDPAFDLRIKSTNFQALNSTKKDNEMFYGIVNFNMNGTVLGKTSAPIVDLNIGINKNTDFTYVLQNAEAQLEKTKGIVTFVNKKDPDNILTRTNTSNDVVIFGGIELHTRLRIDNEAQFNIIIDPKTGDQLNVSGEGDLDYNIKKNGLTTLSGRYDINDGKYSIRLYNLVEREFELESGSSIVWRGGNPMDADLNVTAKYTVKTSASALMASQISGSSEEIKNKYRQKLPFLVYLNVKGELDKPELSFNLGMPEGSRGAIDGTVYSRVKQLNNEEDELNKQVFSLLVLEKFYPNAGSDGSDGGTANLVRTNISDALTDQLNAFSGKLTGNTGIELDFGLNSYTDYQGEATQQRTDLNISAQKKLFNDRLIVRVGSDVNVEGSANPGEENAVIGNVSIQYLLTKDGHWRIEGFRNSQYQNAIDGQIFVNGISLIFRREFNSLNELFNKSITNEDSKKEDEDELKEKDKSIKNEDNDELEDNDDDKSKKDNN